MDDVYSHLPLFFLKIIKTILISHFEYVIIYIRRNINGGKKIYVKTG